MRGENNMNKKEILKKLDDYEFKNSNKFDNLSYSEIEKKYGQIMADNLAREFWAGFHTAKNIIKNN